MDAGFPLHIIFWCLQTNLLNNFIFKISENKYRHFECNVDEKANYAHTFKEKSVLLWCNKNEINDEIIRRKETDIYRKFKFLNFFFIWPEFDTPNVSFYLPTENHFYRNLHHPIQNRLSLLISKSILHNFAKKKTTKISVSLATLLCSLRTLTSLCTVISRNSLRRLVFAIVINSPLMPPWLVKI